MTYVIVFILIITTFIIKKKIFNKIDREEEEYLNTPGRAAFVRDGFPGLVEKIERNTNWTVLKERADYIKIGSSSGEFVAFGLSHGEINALYGKEHSQIQQWKFKKDLTTAKVYETMEPYFEDAFEDTLRKKIADKFDEYIKVQSRQYDSMNDPYVGGMMKDIALSGLYQNMTSPSGRASILPLFEAHGLDFDTIIEEEYQKARIRHNV